MVANRRSGSSVRTRPILLEDPFRTYRRWRAMFGRRVGDIVPAGAGEARIKSIS